MKQLAITVQTPTAEQRLLVPRELQPLRLSEVLRRNAHALNTRCGSRGLCDGCLVQLKSGMLRHHASGKHVDPTHPAMIRACEYVLDNQDITLTIPPRSLLAYEPQVVSHFKLNISRAHDPLWQTIPLHRPSAPDDIAAQIAATLGTASVTLSAPHRQAIAAALRTGPAVAVCEYLPEGWTVTSVSRQAPAGTLGVAIDIGTTTVAILVVDLATGEIRASAGGFNRQMHLGDDVLTRINLCATDRSMLGRLQAAIVKDTIERLLLKALKDAHLSDDRLACFTIAANTTMLHLFAGVDPSPMGHAPFTAPFLSHKTLTASEAHLRLSSPADARDSQTASADPKLHLLPSAAAYVGADITAGVVSSGLAYDDGPSLLVDVGTNGEIVLKYGRKMYAAATAAGPAFEGSRMACGMRAGQGVLSHIRMETTATGLNVKCEVIGDVKPTGLCGSAYVDFLAQARKVGLISEAGRLIAGVADDRIATYRDNGISFRIATGHGNEPIVISEADIASLLQGKAAIAAGILTLLRKIGVRPSEVQRLYLAGGFGMHLDVPNTIGCGLLPGFSPAQVQLVGNTSLAGAYLSLLDAGVLGEIRRVAEEMEIVELNLDPDFENTYIDQLMLV